MDASKSKMPGVLLAILSALGILFGLLIAAVPMVSARISPLDYSQGFEDVSILTTSVLSLVTCGLNIPTFLYSIKKLMGNPVKSPGGKMLPKATILLGVWFVTLALGYFIIERNSSTGILAPLTVIAIIIPIWWLIEFARRGLPRSTVLREWGTLTIGLTITPVLIILVEIVLIIIAALLVLVGVGLRPDWSRQFMSVFQNINIYQSGMDEFEKVLFELMKNPLISIAVYLSIGLIAPIIEEVFKPLATWFLLNRPLKEHEGFSLGLISGGAFALLESTGLIVQLDAQDWLIGITLRAATGVLHIGLSGLVGYGLVSSWNRSLPWRGILFILSAVLLHGTWNSMALLSGFTTTTLPENVAGGSNVLTILSVIPMLAIFVGIIIITLRINSKLAKTLTLQAQSSQ